MKIHVALRDRSVKPLLDQPRGNFLPTASRPGEKNALEGFDIRRNALYVPDMHSIKNILRPQCVASFLPGAIDV
jgi:hypothetical protein